MWVLDPFRFFFLKLHCIQYVLILFALSDRCFWIHLFVFNGCCESSIPIFALSGSLFVDGYVYLLMTIGFHVVLLFFVCTVWRMCVAEHIPSRSSGFECYKLNYFNYYYFYMPNLLLFTCYLLTVHFLLLVRYYCYSSLCTINYVY